MPRWMEAIILGLIEGLTEFIPVSSTGHLLIAERWLGHRPDWFTVFIQVGAALALLPLFWNKLIGLLKNLSDPSARDYLAKLTSAFLLTAAGGVALDKMNFELPETVGPVAWATLIGGFVILGIERWKKGDPGNSHLSWNIPIACGVAQLLAAVFPGTSRSGATIMIAIALGLARSEAAEFSFILGMITLTAAGGYKFLDAWKDGEVVGANLTDIGLGFATAAVSSFLVVRWLLQFVREHSFNGFAIYRILLGIALLLWGAEAK
ncbi:MAG: undecaprenyl-diphosphate phosphatase [Bryobacteraceae bacterium]|nr:undecaprenyl-diphosphate phosphatase [Bryobacteraceae bacterium]